MGTLVREARELNLRLFLTIWLVAAVICRVQFSCAATPVTSTLIEDFESGGLGNAVSVTTLNSAAGGSANTAISNTVESGSKRLRLTDSDGGYNGCVLTFPNAITAAGNYIVTAEVKVDNSSAAISSFGMGVALGSPSTAKVSDTHGGYVMNLTGSGDAALGYQTIGASLNVTGSVFPQNLTIYFGTNPTGNNYSAPAADGTFRFGHRTNASTWPSGSSNAVYMDNIKITGPGNFGEDRHFWISAGNSYCNLAQVQLDIDVAQKNHFNCVDILARFRSDAYYVPHRDFNTYPNPEPYGTLVSGGTPGPANDPLQYLIDHCHELGMKAYISFSCFLATPNDTYPAYLPSGSATWIYNAGTPRLQVSADSSEGVWADVGRADVRAHCINVMQDIVQNYDIDGVIFDRIRYEHNDYGYNPTAITDLGYAPGTVPAPTNATFVDRRRKAVTKYLHDAYVSATTQKPWMVVGTVPIVYFTSFSDTYSDVFQFWPQWTAEPTANRIISFGAEDCIQPQFYRTIGTYQGYNSIYLDLARYGDLSSYSLDYGLMPGSNVHLCPLFYHPSAGSTPQSSLNAMDLCDARNKEANGGGIYSADTVRSDIHLIRTTPTLCNASDILADAVPNADFLMKAGYDNTAPNALSGITATPNGSLGVNLSWAAPSAAADGETATRFLVYRGTQPGVKQYYATLRNKAVTVSATSYLDTVPASGNYYYSIVPVDDYNNRGAATEYGPVNVTGTAASSTPSAPSNVKAVACGNVVYVTWNDNSGIERTFDLQRDGITIATLGENMAAYTDNNVAAGSHTYGVRATNSFGNSSFASASAVTAANTLAAPTASGSNASGYASLTFSSAASTRSGFEILRSTVSGGPYTQVATVGPAITTYLDAVPSPGTYYYRVRVFNGTAISLYSTELTLNLGPPTEPAAPSGLNAAVNISTVDLTWTDNSSNETGFDIRRSATSGGPYTSIGTTGQNVASFTDTSPLAGTSYYIVVATNGVGDSPPSNEAVAVLATPNPPTGLAAHISGSNVGLTWTDNSNNETGFAVFRSSTSGGPYNQVLTTSSNVTATTESSVPTGTWYYVVRAFNGIGNSAYSNQVAVSVFYVSDIIVESRLPGGAVNGAPAYQESSGFGSWNNTTAKSLATGLVGTGGRYTGTGSLGAYAIFAPTIVTEGFYDVFITCPNATNGPNVGSPGAGFQIVHNGTDVTGTVDIVRTNSLVADTWFPLASSVHFDIGTGGYVKVTNNNTSSADSLNRFDMDAVKFAFVSPAPVAVSKFSVE